MTNEASEALAAVRAERQANKEALRAAVDGWARALVAKGAAEPGAVSIVRNRFCVGVRVRNIRVKDRKGRMWTQYGCL